jgi:hypothetical protein
LGKSLALTIGMRITRIQTNTDYLNYEYLKTWEVIAPGVTAERVQNLGFVTRDRYSAQNMLFHFNTGLKIRLNP